MPVRTPTELKTEIATKVAPSSAQDRISAAELRSVLVDMVESLFSRIILDVGPTDNTLDKIIIHTDTHEAFLTEPRIVAGTPATAVFGAFAQANYLGVESVDDWPGAVVGNWYLNSGSFRPRVLTDLDPTAGVRLSWGDVTFGVVIPSNPKYLGEFPSDDAAEHAPNAAVGDLYFNTTSTTENPDGQLRVVRSITPAVAPQTVYDLDRLSTAKDIRRLIEADTELREGLQAVRQSLIGEGVTRARGDDLQSVMVNTEGSYNGTLDSQLGSDQPLMLTIGADITGTRHAETFNWSENDVLYFAPLSDSPEFLFNTGGSGGGNANFIAEEVLTTTYYDTVLTAQASRNRPLFIWVTAAISGSRGGSSYSWDPQDILYVQPNSDTPIELFNLGATPDDIRLVDQRRADGDAALAARIENLDRNLSFDPPYFVRDTAASPPARTFIVHVPPSSQPAGTTHVGLVIQGTNASTRVEVSAAGAYTFTIPSAGVGNISRVQSSTATVRVSFYDQSSGGNELGHDDDVIRLLANAPSELPTDGEDGEFLGHVRGAPAWVANPWPGEVFVIPHEIKVASNYPSTDIRAILNHTPGQFPAGSRMRLSYSKTIGGALISAVGDYQTDLNSVATVRVPGNSLAFIVPDSMADEFIEFSLTIHPSGSDTVIATLPARVQITRDRHQAQVTALAETTIQVQDIDVADITLDKNITLRMGGGRNGSSLLVRILQDSTGNFTVTLHSEILRGGRAAPVVSPGAGTRSYLMFTGISNVWHYLGIITDE